MKLKKLAHCFGRAVVNTINHDGIEHAGYLAFLGLLALFPFLVFIVALMGVIVPDAITIQYVAALFRKLPHEVIASIEPRIVEITSGPPQGLLTLAIVGAIWTASSAVEGIRTVLNRAYHVGTPPAYLWRRSLSILQLLIFAFVFTVGIILLVTIPVMLRHIETWLGLQFLSADDIFWSRVLYAGTLLILFGAVSYIYYAIPNIRQHFISVAPGAALVIILWLLAAQLFTGYLTHFNQVTLIYGSLGGIIAALVFFYICNIIFIFGAEFNYLFSRELGMIVEQREEAPPPPPDRDDPPYIATPGNLP